MIDQVTILAAYGPLGIICAWFMFRMEKVINNNTTALNQVLQKVEACPRKRNI